MLTFSSSTNRGASSLRPKALSRQCLPTGSLSVWPIHKIEIKCSFEIHSVQVFHVWKRNKEWPWLELKNNIRVWKHMVDNTVWLIAWKLLLIREYFLFFFSYHVFRATILGADLSGFSPNNAPGTTDADVSNVDARELKSWEKGGRVTVGTRWRGYVLVIPGNSSFAVVSN